MRLWMGTYPILYLSLGRTEVFVVRVPTDKASAEFRKCPLLGSPLGSLVVIGAHQSHALVALSSCLLETREDSGRPVV